MMIKLKEGIIIVNKPRGATSHDIVDFVRRKLAIKKVGHAGTLDPMATGVLVILLGRYTRLFNHFLTLDKEYVATLTLGAKTTSGDIQGKIIQSKGFEHITEEMAKKVFAAYIGEIYQTPPMVSAVKYKGKPLYKLAWKGKEVKRSARKVLIKELQLLQFNLPEVKFYLRCSRGTYVRQLAEDLAKDLGSLAYVSQIERVGVGPYKLNEAITLPEIEESKIRTCAPFPS
jgi:tRNA pseudouridine55 synthase